MSSHSNSNRKYWNKIMIYTNQESSIKYVLAMTALTFVKCERSGLVSQSCVVKSARNINHSRFRLM